MYLPIANIKLFDHPLLDLPLRKSLITTLNAHSYNTARKDPDFAEVLSRADVLLPDGISIVWAMRFLTGKKLHKIAGADLFHYEMNRLNQHGGSCFFLGSSEDTLTRICHRAKRDFPNVKIDTYAPPYKPTFSPKENAEMIAAINTFRPDVLFIGMTAPKQEKWAYEHFQELDAKHICPIGAVFDFYAGTVSRAPRWMIRLGLEWLYRLLREPRRLWRRYLIGNTKFILSILKQKWLKSNRTSLPEKRI